MKLRSTSSAEENFPDEILWISWKRKQNQEIWPFLDSLLEKWVWESGPKIDPATGVILLKQGIKIEIPKNWTRTLQAAFLESDFPMTTTPLKNRENRGLPVKTWQLGSHVLRDKRPDLLEVKSQKQISRSVELSA